MATEKQALLEFADVLIDKMFQVKPGETVAITVDSDSRLDIAKALFNKVKESKGLPFILHIPVGRGDGEVGMPDWPTSPLQAALLEVDVWIEMNSAILLYSQIWENAIQKNKKLRYLIIGTSSVESLHRVFASYDVPTLGRLLRGVMTLARDANEIRVTSINGTDVKYLMDPKHALDIDDGDYSKPIFGTAPGYVNLVPKVGSMNGRIVFDELMNTDIYGSDESVAFEMKDGKIAEVVGGSEAAKFRAYLSSFDDPNMYKISHHMIGLNPGVREMVGEIVEDERVWGGTDFGFGYTSPIDMPPDGQIAKSHFDGVVAKTTIYIDGTKIVDKGEVCHPVLIPFAHELIGSVV